jgi:hypothetical protein
MTMAAAPDLVLFTETRTLTDESVVHNVVIGDLSVPAHSKEAAEELAEAIMDAIHEHSPWIVGIVNDA